jgi:hypothetical protein
LRDKHKTAIEIWKANKKKEQNRDKIASEIKRKSISCCDINENAKVKAEIEKWRVSSFCCLLLLDVFLKQC